ncbi:putative disease resistance protein At3g14460 [Telopea speciosissima]|uniref:putative disease resistance protein At3g14460 n=1 Tax=Telopea speciosissima TaxID=54955 RepID=UPI001CC50A67|nr:putative disease resistance protein At3g14460 [Telopea speciosissima]
MGLRDITLISSPLLQILQRLEMSLTMLKDAELQKLGDPAKQKDEALDIINSIYDNSVALSNISLQLETIGKLVRSASSEQMVQMGEIEKAGESDKDPLLPVHTHHEIVQSKPGKEQVSAMDTKINEGSTSEVANSFNNLPQHLKRRVIYTCILFLEDYEFEEDTLIQLSPTVIENYEPTYRVHKDVYEVIKQCCPDHEYAILMEEGEPNNMSPVTLHSTLLLGDKIFYLDMKIFERFYEAELLRTLKLQNECGSPINHVSHNCFVKLRFLRVLGLSSTEIKDLPTSVCNLRHLRYIDVSNTRIKKLPESVSKLCNLETLKLRDCSDPVALPKEMSTLINLQHLDLDGTHQLTSMPPRMGKLTNLQKLSKFIVGSAEGFRIEELKCMKKLRGSICIAKMENVTEDQANEFKLNYKVAIQKQEFQWSSSSQTTGMVLRAFQTGYPGTVSTDFKLST